MVDGAIAYDRLGQIARCKEEQNGREYRLLDRTHVGFSIIVSLPP